MGKALGLTMGAAGLGLLGYFLAWPVPIDPQAWDAPVSEGYVGDYTPNEALAGLELIPLGGHHGPEDVVASREAGTPFIYATSQTGDILKINLETNEVARFAQTGGSALGMEMDANGALIVADAFQGLLSVGKDGSVRVLADRVDDTPILYADDLDIGEDGVIYFSDASTKFGAEAAGETLAASILEIFEFGQTGRILAYDPASETTWVVADGFSFPNGVALDRDEQSILVAETGAYRVLRIFVDGPRAGEVEPLIENLPGFPDNINRGGVLADGRRTFFLGLAGPRAPSVDKLSSKPFLRKVIWRLPQAFHPKPVPYGFVMEFAEDGEILRTWQDPAGAYPTTTGAIAPGDGYLYVTSLEAHDLGRIAYP